MSERERSEGGAPGRGADKAVSIVAALVLVAFGVLLVDLVRQQAWLDIVLLVVGGALVTLCFVLQRATRPPTS